MGRFTSIWRAQAILRRETWLLQMSAHNYFETGHKAQSNGVISAATGPCAGTSHRFFIG